MRVKPSAGLPLNPSMSDPGALLCVRSDHPASARRWRRRTPAAHTAAAPRAGAVLRSVGSRSWRRPLQGLVGAVLLFGVGWAALTAAWAHSGDSAFSRRVGAGCEALEQCLSLEAEAARRLDACALFCERAAEEYDAARLMRFRAEERRAVREHYRERDRAERRERQDKRAERLDEWRRQRAARAEDAARARQHQLELERLRQEYIERRIADERRRRVGYLAALGPDGRALRLKNCLALSPRCDALVLDLLDATRDVNERRALAEMNEGMTRAAPAEQKQKDVPAPESTAPASAATETAETKGPALALPPVAADVPPAPSS